MCDVWKAKIKYTGVQRNWTAGKGPSLYAADSHLISRPHVVPLNPPGVITDYRVVKD